jgi:uncharacterized protein (DUF2267 family)
MQDEHVDTAEENFLRRVQQHSGLTSRTEARRLTEATLSALAVAVSAGQVTQLARHLPVGLQPGHRAAGQAVKFDKAALLDTVSGAVPSTDPEEIEILTSAVLNTVREQLPAAQMSDTLAQLPDDLAALFHGAPGDRQA